MSVPSPLDQADGSVELRIDPRGTIAAPVLNATINGRGIRVPGIDDAGELDSTVAIDRRALSIESLDARLGALRMNASGDTHGADRSRASSTRTPTTWPRSRRPWTSPMLQWLARPP